MGPDATRTTRQADQSLNDMVASLAQEAIGKGSTALLDEEMLVTIDDEEEEVIVLFL